MVPKSSTVMALISMIHSWLQATEQPGHVVRTILFDFRKAFDLIDHKRLVGKLQQLNISLSSKNWIIDFLIGRSQRVKLGVNNFYSWRHVQSGVPQGTKSGL